MASIHWLAWTTIGLIVVFTAYRVGGNLALFMWVGLAFLLIGIAKAVHRFVFTPRAKPKQEAHLQTPSQTHHFVRCARCMTVASAKDNYCKVCGTMIRVQAHPRQVVH